jgi:two-component system phosphate regulon sensor histidine kinase PhoR
MMRAMIESLFGLRGRIWAITGGMIAGGAAVLLFGQGILWAIIVFALAGLLISRFVAFQEPVLVLAERRPEEPRQILPPLARAVIEQLPAPVLLLDSRARGLFANQPMRAVIGTAVEGRPLTALIRNPAVLDAVAATADSGEAGFAEFSLPVPIARFYQAYTAAVSDSTVALLLHDVTAIRRSEQMRADFVANASHELRTPLAAVSGFIETLRGHARDDAEARDRFLGIMSVEAARMRRLIDDLLSLTRIELNEHVRPEGRIRLENIVREAAAALAPLAADDNITVTVKAAEGLPQVVGERDELVQLFQNLIHNAIKYGRQGGMVEIAVEARDGQVAAAVRDDGEGIPAGAIPRLTERFYRVDVKRSRERGGTGLGLAIVKHIVSRHQGRLTIESKPGQGSIFTVYLPEAPREIPARAAPAAAERGAVTEML